MGEGWSAADGAGMRAWGSGGVGVEIWVGSLGWDVVRVGVGVEMD